MEQAVPNILSTMAFLYRNLIVKAMVTLQAPVAREIDKAAVIEGVNFAVHNQGGQIVSQSQEEGMKAGDFYFRSNTLARYEDASWFRRVIFRQPQELVVEHPTTIVMS